jgi:serine/threonine-protein kinase
MASAQDNVRWEQSLQSAGNVLLVPSEALPGALSKSQELSYQVPQMVSCLDVLQAKVPAANFTDKVVLVGLTSKSKQGSQDGLTAAAFWPLESLAPAAASLMQIQTTPEPLWGIWFTFATTLAVILFMALGVPNLPSGAVIALCLVAGAGFLALEFCLIAWAHVWLRMVFPALLLGIILLLQLLHRFSPRRMKTVSAATAPEQTDRMMGLALQGQGQLDMAFERFQRIPMDDVVAADLYWLAMEYQRLLRFENATAVYQYIARYAPDFKDVRARLSDPTSTNVPAQSTKASTDLVMGQSNESNQVPRAALGRYRIEKPLGKGAMGVVYLGKDPKIGRQVAIKTMALSQEFDGLELADARDRFFREAKAAGRLQHPGIVTIFDVGEEADLGFIAMEYVTGQDLKAFCKPGQLMPVPRVVSIVARVAQALAHAHRQQVIHRDIKPGNVMYDLVTDTVKITDFGIARITDGNKTRTGIVLGSPSYMAPEQLAGLTLDGRSDLYALGAMLFQLLTGVLPFRAETLADLMAKIANEPAPDVRQLRGDISEELARIVGRLLEKLPEKRYQDGESLASDLYSYAERVQSRVAPLTPKSAPVPAKSLDLEL